MIKTKIVSIINTSTTAVAFTEFLNLNQYEIVAIVSSLEMALTEIVQHNADLLLLDLAGKDDNYIKSALSFISEKVKIPIVFLHDQREKELLKSQSIIPHIKLLEIPATQRELTLSIEMALYHAHMEKKMVYSMNKLNKTFLNLGLDFSKNINLLTETCGQLLGANFALYNRLSHGQLCSLGSWNIEQSLDPIANPEGHICYDLINSAHTSGQHLFIIKNLPSTKYFLTDFHVDEMSLKTYIGNIVLLNDEPIGILCALFNKHVDFDDNDKKILGILAKAISIEEERKKAEDQLVHYTAEIELKNMQLEAVYDKINRDIYKARKLHQQFLPNPHYNAHDFFIASYYQPAESLGGDFYHVIPVGDQLLIYVTDVTGHGLDGAMLTIFLRETINSFLMSRHKTHQPLCPKKLLNFLFYQYCQENFPEDYFISIFVGVLDFETKEFIYSSAGFQIAPLTISSDGNMEKLYSCGLPLSSAIEPSLLDFQLKSFFFDSDTTILITTDGLVEEVNNEDIYGEERLARVFSSVYNNPPELIVKEINADFYSFAGTHQGNDDITFLVIQRLGKNISYFLQANSSLEEVDILKEIVSEKIIQHLQEPDMFLFGVIEMINNALEHGNKFNHDKLITINIIVGENHLRIVITDEGSGFNSQKRLNKQYDINNFEERGRGIIITQIACDHVYYNKLGNQVTLIKRI